MLQYCIQVIYLSVNSRYRPTDHNQMQPDRVSFYVASVHSLIY